MTTSIDAPKKQAKIVPQPEPEPEKPQEENPNPEEKKEEEKPAEETKPEDKKEDEPEKKDPVPEEEKKDEEIKEEENINIVDHEQYMQHKMMHYYQPLYVMERIPAPQLFSDENPNACSVM
ncbi:hypothetical protein ABTG41_08380 [Acinetobacter baumannii]